MDANDPPRATNSRERSHALTKYAPLLLHEQSVEVRAEVLDDGWLRIPHADAADVAQNQVLGDLYTSASAAKNRDCKLMRDCKADCPG